MRSNKYKHTLITSMGLFKPVEKNASSEHEIVIQDNGIINKCIYCRCKYTNLLFTFVVKVLVE